MEVVARQVNRQRRVGLPRKLALRSGIEPAVLFADVHTDAARRIRAALRDPEEV